MHETEYCDDLSALTEYVLLDRNLTKFFLFNSIFIRPLPQDPRDLPFGFPHEIYGPLHVLYQFVQHFDEDFLHWFNCFHHFLDEIQETILLCKYKLSHLSDCIIIL